MSEAWRPALSVRSPFVSTRPPPEKPPGPPRLGELTAPTLTSPGTGTDSRAAAPESLVGRCLGDFEVLEEIGRGGMGAVFKAKQKSLDRIVALKVLLSEHLLNPVRSARFLAEARIIAGL